MKEMEKKLYNILAEILKISAKSINDATAPANVASWDSYNTLMIAGELERIFGVVFTVEDISQSYNVGDIKKVLHRYGIDIL